MERRCRARPPAHPCPPLVQVLVQALGQAQQQALRALAVALAAPWLNSAIGW